MAAVTPQLEQVLPAFVRRFPTQLVEADQSYGENQLFVGLDPDAKGRPRRLELTFLPREEDDLHYLQFFVLMPFSVEPRFAADLARVIAQVNVKVPVGHFGMNETEGWIYFRSVSPVLPAPLDEELTVGTAWMCYYLVDQLGGLLESAADGSSSVDQAALALEDVLARQPPPDNGRAPHPA
jgi:hypothetical protein